MTFTERFERFKAQINRFYAAARSGSFAQYEREREAWEAARQELIGTPVQSDADALAATTFLGAEAKIGRDMAELAPLVTSLRLYLDPDAAGAAIH